MKYMNNLIKLKRNMNEENIYEENEKEKEKHNKFKLCLEA